MASYRPAAKPRANELVEQLSGLTKSGVVQELPMRRLRNQAQDLMQSDPAGAHTVLGGVAALDWNLKAVRDHFRIALQHDAHAGTYYNYSVALSNVEATSEAFDAAQSAYRQAEDDKFLLGNAIEHASKTAHFTLANNLCRRWTSLSPEESHPLSSVLLDLEKAIERRTFDEESVREVLGLMSTVQRTEKARTESWMIHKDSDDPSSFHYWNHVAVSAKNIASVNGGFVEELLANDHLLVEPGLHFVVLFIGVSPDGRDG